MGTDGKREGIREGILEGERKGRREGLVELVLTILELRGLAPDAETRARIVGCKRLDRLERLAARAKQIDRADELFVH